VRIWDLRRLIVPLSYFIERPFQNWTREGADLLASVILPLDYTAPLEAIRTKARELAEASPHWDRKVFNVQVTDSREHSMEVRILLSAASAGRAWDLRCEIREKIIAFLQREHPTALPRRRQEVVAFPDRDAVAKPAQVGPA
jgi:small-conductance mechanosensitive channel